jgi:hypothetical protein
MSRPAGAQQPSVALKIKIKLRRMGDFTVDDCSSWTISTPIGISIILGEKPKVGWRSYKN